MDALVRAGKVVAFALSNFPAWQVAHAATLADLRGWAPVAAIHYQYNLVERGAEREHLPMADALSLAVLAWSPQARGALARGALARTPLSGLPDGLAAALDVAAAARGNAPGAIALAWLLRKGVIPVVGARDADQLRGALAATEVALSPEEAGRLDAALPQPVYPAPLLARLREGLGIPPAIVAEAQRGAPVTAAA